MKYIDKFQRTAMLLVLLCVGWVTGCPVSAQISVDIVPDPSTNLVGSDNGSAIQPLESMKDGEYGVLFTFSNESGGTQPAYYYNGSAIRLYAGNTFTVESTRGFIIERIEFQSVAYKSTENTLGIITEDGEILSVPYDAETLIYTWKNTSAKSKETFHINDTQLRISSIRVTFASSEVVNALKAPVFSQYSCDFYEDFELSLIDLNEPNATIVYTMDGTTPSADNGTVYVAPIIISAGNDVTVKAVSINEYGTSLETSATYNFVSTCSLHIKWPNKNGISYVYYSSNTEYGYFYEESSTRVREGDKVYIEYGLTTGYKATSITLNGEKLNVSRQYFDFVMPDTDAELVFNSEFDPASPSDPQPGDTTKRYRLTLVCNPVGAGYTSSTEKSYAVGSSFNINAYTNSGYVFTGWTRDGETISTKSSFNFTMPATDVVLTANYVYNPSSPSDPEQPKLKHPLTVIASPEGSGTFSYTGSTVAYGSEYYVYAYPNSGYKFKGWIVNGVAQEETTSQLRGVMTETGASVVGLFVFDPASPSNPGANYYNPTTGQAIIDDFTPGSIYSAMRDVIGSDNFANVSSLIVKGKLESGDYGSLSYLTNATTIDLSRTGGTTTVPGYAFQNLAAVNILLSSEVTQLGNYVFSNCANLTSLTMYAQVPPTCSLYTFNGFTNKDNCTVFVPSSAIELYTTAEYWKDFTILPISTDAHVLQVNLPEEAADGRYKNNSLEIININSGVRQKYVISDRLLYTFNGLRKDEQYNIYMHSQSGLEIGRIENVVIPDHDIEVSFDNLKTLHTVYAKVVTTEGMDVTSQVSVEWLKPQADGTMTYLRKSDSLGEVPEGQELLCRVSLDNNLGVVYVDPEDLLFKMEGENNICTVTLEPFRTISLSGILIDGDGVALSGASVSVNQTLNEKYSKTFTAKTDKRGAWTVSVFDAPETRITYAASECVSVHDTIGAFEPSCTALDLGKQTLKSIVGARITYGFVYRAAGSEEVDSYYADHQNVAISVFNETQSRAHREVSLQYPILAVLDENINAGDLLKLTASSKTGTFHPIEQTVVVGENQRAEVSFELIGKGGITASFEMTENPAVTAMLYSASGELMKKMAYTEAVAKFLELEDGDYTLISMGQSDLMNSILRLSNFAEIGLVEGKDYVKNTVSVESGKLTEIKNSEIPAFDESLFYYTNSSTSFSANKSSITTGGYLTLRSTIDFKGVYKNDISNVVLVVDFPEACDFVDQSVIQGPNLLPYVYDNNRLTIQLGNDYKSQVRFCVVPTTGGSFNATASIVFDYKGKSMTQPIGSASAEIKDIEITVPSVIAGTTFKVTGTALPKSDVKVYENGTLLGTGKANGAGAWNIECELVKPYNLSTHSIYAEITTPAGNTLTSETKNLTYDINALQVSKVTMYHWNPEMRQTYVSVFDFLNPKTSATQWTVYYPKKVFTYTIEFTDNDPERISNVILYVHTADGKFVPVNASFDEQKGLWYAEIDMGRSSDGYYPVNCSVDFDYLSTPIVDAEEYNKSFNSISISQEDLTLYEAELDSISSIIENLSDDEFSPELVSSLLRESRIISRAGADMKITDVLENMSEEEALAYFMVLTSEIDVLLSQNSWRVFDETFNESINKVLSEVAGISTSTCEGFTPDLLKSLGYTEIAKSDSSCIYILATEAVYNMVDLENNSFISIDLKADTNIAKIAKLRISDDFVQSMNEYLKQTQQYWNELRDVFTRVASLVEEVITEVAEKKAANILKLHQVDYAIEWLEKQSFKNDPYWIAQKRGWIKQRNSLNKNIAQNGAILDWLNKNFSPNGLRIGRLGGGIFAVVDVGLIIAEAIKNFNSITKLYISIPNPCKDDQAAADNLRSRIRNTGTAAGVFYTAQLLSDVIQIASLFSGVAAIVPSGGTSLGLVAGSVSLAVANFLACKAYERIFDNRMKEHYSDAISLECLRKCGQDGEPKCPDPYPNTDDGGNGGRNNNGGGANQSGSTSDVVQIDPSGFVYEAVPTNRVVGVQATIYYKETKEDMYGDLYDEIILWNAEEYAQKNPLFTDEHGMYRWDVPQGLWQVKFEKDGYQTTFSEWLPVPPPQLEVNVGIVQNKQPEITEARAYEEGVEIQFDKFMDLTTLTTDNIYVTANGEKLNGEISFVNSALADEYASEDDVDAIRFASRVRFVPETSLSLTTGEIRLTVSRNVLSYAGIPMAEAFSQVLDVEKEVQYITAADVKVLYGEEKEVTVYALPYEAAVGRVLRISCPSSLIASIDTKEITLDEEGKAVVKVKGELPGTTQLSFAIDNVTATGSCAVDVVTEIILAEAPKSSRASGTAVYRGTKIELTTESKDAVIYFTTDGSCPCDEEGTRRKYTVPIVIEDDIQILAMTSVGTGAEEVSETVEFNYTLKRSDMDFQMEEGWTWMSHSFETPVSPTEFAADEAISRIVSQTQEVIRDPQLGLVGTLAELKATESYKVQTSTTTDRQRLSDVAWNPATPISINSGWNWLGYPVSQTMSVDEAFATTEVERLDVVVGQNGFAQYDGEKWVGTMETMSPGMGYMYQSQSPKNIVYNTSIVSTAAAKNVAGISSKLPLVLNIHKYPSIMPLVATLCGEDGATFNNEDYQVIAFCGTECRGIGRIVDGLVMMNVYGNVNDHISLQVTDVDGEKNFSTDASLIFREAIVGDIFNPYKIAVDRATSVDKVTYAGNIKVSIVDDLLKINGIASEDIDFVEVYDINGQRIIYTSNVPESGIKISILTNGVYVVVVNGNGEYTYHKVAVH